MLSSVNSIAEKQSLELGKSKILQSTTFTHKNEVVQDQYFNKRISKAFYQQNKGSKLFVKQRKKLYVSTYETITKKWKKKINKNFNLIEKNIKKEEED